MPHSGEIIAILLIGELNRQFLQLLVIDRGRRIQHHIPAAVVLRESDKIADTLAAAEDRAEPVESECNASMRGSAVFKGAKQEPELMLGLLRAHAQGRKHFLL